MLRTIKTFIKDPEPVSKFEDVEPGLNIVEGIVRVEEPIRSPVRGQNCVAFFYRSFFMITGGRAPTIHKLKQAEVYTDFVLELEGGELDVVPSRKGKFEQRDHLELQKQYGSGFQGVEDVVLPGARVRVRGKAKQRGDRTELTLKDIEVIDKQAVAAGVVGNRKKRRKKKR
jgi:hypothetical protein